MQNAMISYDPAHVPKVSLLRTEIHTLNVLSRTVFENLYGVLQDGVLSPNFFNIFLEDLPNYLSSESHQNSIFVIRG